MTDATTTPQTLKKGPLPLGISVTGHRDLRPEDITALEDKVRGVFTELTIKYPFTPLTVLSPLAEGADRLVARIALECGARLVAPLPMPQELYEQDFASEASRAEFRALLAQAEQQFVVPFVAGSTADDMQKDAHRRNQQYAMVGAYIALHSQVVIALWDGIDLEDDTHLGGTAQIVRFNLQGVPEPYAPPRSLLDTPERGAVHHIVTPRAGQPLPPYEPFSLRMLYPEDTNADTFNRTNERMELFNRDVVEMEGDLVKAKAQSKQYLLAPDKLASLPPALQQIVDYYAAADAMAIHFAQRTTKTMARVFASVFIAALCFNLFHSLPHPHPPGDHGEAAAPHHATQPTAPHQSTAAMTHFGATAHAAPPDAHAAPAKDKKDAHAAPAADSHAADAHGAASHPDAAPSWLATLAQMPWFGQVPWFLVLFLGVSAFSSLVLHRRAAAGDYQNKHQDYRALAEGMRMQVFWDLAGLRESVADHYLGRQRGELEWIRNAIRVWNITAASGQAVAPASEAQQHEWMNLAYLHWVEDQRKYYAKKAHHEQEELEHDERRINRLIGFSVGLAILLAFILLVPLALPLSWLQTVKHWIENEWIHGFYMVLLVMSAVGAGLLHGYNQQRARSEHAKQFGRMSVLFHIAEQRLKQMLDSRQYAEAQSLLRELGKESLEENGDWVLLHRERPLEVPHAA